jgi:hypothetical protein
MISALRSSDVTGKIASPRPDALSKRKGPSEAANKRWHISTRISFANFSVFALSVDR